MRDLVKKNYILIMNMLWKTHKFFEASLLATHNYKTSQAAHHLLEKRMMRKCEEEKKIDYGLKILPGTEIKIADSEEFLWLLQPELKAIKDGLKYGEKQGFNSYGMKWNYRGYLNAYGQLQGVGIKTFKYYKEIGEFYRNKMHGICMI
jgi:hypothetical protein